MKRDIWKSKQHLSSHVVYLFMFENGLDLNWKDAILVIVPQTLN